MSTCLPIAPYSMFTAAAADNFYLIFHRLNLVRDRRSHSAGPEKKFPFNPSSYAVVSFHIQHVHVWLPFESVSYREVPVQHVSDGKHAFSRTLQAVVVSSEQFMLSDNACSKDLSANAASLTDCFPEHRHSKNTIKGLNFKTTNEVQRCHKTAG